eukprot:TRINITY_DN6692_c0_g2_i1.p1 TRINITY_DN6692_c0_g2~~TRINITY_DN6692_c0_g2_i1.p1  ORF type:complete len:164 (+),score=37.03 TRINITY_DN6692_c0_g2_i1:60-494(+)
MCIRDSLRLNLGETLVTDQSIILLSKSLKNASRLTEFSLTLSWNHVSDKGIAQLIDSLLSMPLLSNLNLHLGGCQLITDRTAEGLAYLAATKTTITILSLWLARTGVTAEGVTKVQKEKSERHMKFYVNPVSYTHLTLPTIYSV